MNRHRYEPVAQRDDSQPIILSPIPTSSNSSIPGYNFNSGLPSGSTAPSSIAPSIPNSPPPSFHSHSPPRTPRPLPSQELWGVAPSTIATTDTSNDHLATIAGLKQRVEWLEESIGRLLLEKDTHTCNAQNVNSGSDGGDDESGSHHNSRSNCCVTFSDASPDIERALMKSGSNCCVTFRGRMTKEDRERERHRRLGIIAVAIFFIGTIGIVIASMSNGRQGVTTAGIAESQG